MTRLCHGFAARTRGQAYVLAAVLAIAAQVLAFALGYAVAGGVR
jgi:hypothetical protein